MDAKEIGKKLKQLRLEKGLKQSELAKALNVSDKLISKWETGISVPSTEFTLEICEFFGIEVGEFLNLTSPTKANNTNKKELSKGKKLAIKISVIVLGAYILLSLIFFLIIPFACKNSWLNDIDKHLQNVLDRGYYSFEISASVDGAMKIQTENAKIEDGVIYYERLSADGGVLCSVVGNVEYDGLRSYSVLAEGYSELSEILCYADKDEETFSIINDIDANYILKTTYGYKFAVKGFTIPGASIQGKVIADVFLEGQYFKEMDLHFKIKKGGEILDCFGAVVFDLSAPPKDIVMFEASYVKWEMEHSFSLSQLTKEQLGGTIRKKHIEEDGELLVYGNNIVFCGRTSVKIYDGKTLTLKKEYSSVIDASIYDPAIRECFITKTHLYVNDRWGKILKINLSNGTKQTITASSPENFSLLCDNLFVLPNGNIYYSVYDPVTVEEKKINNTTKKIVLGDIFFCDGTYFYTRRLESSPKNYTIRKYDLNDNLIEEYNDLLSGCVHDFVGYENQIFYFERASFDKDFNLITEYVGINVENTKVYAQYEDRLFANNGIFYTDKFKPPIPVSDISNAVELDDFIVLVDASNNYYSVSK